MGPIDDECGAEQGGINSSEYYKIYNNPQLEITEESHFGIAIGPIIISSIGQADDVALLSDDIHALQGLLELSLHFWKKFHVQLSTEKTKLQVYSSRKLEDEAFFCQAVHQIKIWDEAIKFVEEAEHVGILRSVHGNLAHLQARFSAHRNQMFSILPIGLARGHRGNPAAAIRAHQIYCLPVLLSGTAALILKNSEIKLIDQYVKDTISNLLKLMPRTPVPVVHFLSGQLPGTALLHIRQLTLFGMVCHLKDSSLHRMSEHQLSSSKLSNGSWIMQVRDLCIKYHLPAPLSLLQFPPPKFQFKSLVKSCVVDYWETKLRSDAAPLDSLKYFKPEFMSLMKPHPVWTTCGSNPFEVNKATIQARMLSGRYLTDQLSRHWTSNKAGTCTLPGCADDSIGSVEHILLKCSALQLTRQKMLNLAQCVASSYPPVKDVIAKALSSQDHKETMQFLLDCSCLPQVVTLQQMYGCEPLQYLFYVTRTWCYSIHRRRMDLLGLYQFR